MRTEHSQPLDIERSRAHEQEQYREVVHVSHVSLTKQFVSTIKLRHIPMDRYRDALGLASSRGCHQSLLSSETSFSRIMEDIRNERQRKSCPIAVTITKPPETVRSWRGTVVHCTELICTHGGHACMACDETLALFCANASGVRVPLVSGNHPRRRSTSALNIDADI